jgi:NitT/TauT family transport system substrate-binding protein
MPNIFKTLTVAGALALFAGGASAQQTTNIRFTLGWKTQGSDAAFFVARDKGYFAREGLNVTIDQGEGSGATVTRIMGGAYDAGFGDINAIIQNAAANPGLAPVMVFQMWNQPPFAVVARNAAGIKTIKDFEGKTLGGAQGTPTTRLMPVFARMNGLDLGKIKFTNMAPNLQEPMLLQGHMDAAMVFNITSYFNLVGLGQDPDRDFTWFSFADFGMDLYSNGLMVSQRLLRENPRAVQGLVRAVSQATVDVGRDIAGAMASVRRFDQLIDNNVEQRRLRFAYEKLMTSAEAKEIGVGDVKDDRLARSIDMVVQGYGLTRTPTPAEIFNRTYLPPRAERELVYLTN